MEIVERIIARAKILLFVAAAQAEKDQKNA